jgi:hypothetical protein
MPSLLQATQKAVGGARIDRVLLKAKLPQTLLELVAMGFSLAQQHQQTWLHKAVYAPRADFPRLSATPATIAHRQLPLCIIYVHSAHNRAFIIRQELLIVIRGGLIFDSTKRDRLLAVFLRIC